MESAIDPIKLSQDRFFSKLNVLDAVRSGVKLKEAVNALPDKETASECWQWLHAIEHYTHRTAPEESKRAETARGMIMDRYRPKAKNAT